MMNRIETHGALMKILPAGTVAISKDPQDRLPATGREGVTFLENGTELKPACSDRKGTRIDLYV